jgi:hypothetical protein
MHFKPCKVTSQIEAAVSQDRTAKENTKNKQGTLA